MNPQKLRSLLERAAHPATGEEEARSCALIAAKAIVAEGLPPFGPAQPQQATDPGDNLLVALERARRLALEQKVSDLDRELQRLRGKPGADAEAPAYFSHSRYSGTCRTCQREYYEGEAIYWKRGVGGRHIDCGWPGFHKSVAEEDEEYT